MRIIADYNRISDISNEIKKRCLELLEKKELINNELDMLLNVDKTPSVEKLINEYRLSIKQIDNVYEGIMYYVDYMNNVSKQYSRIHDDVGFNLNRFKGDRE